MTQTQLFKTIAITLTQLNSHRTHQVALAQQRVMHTLHALATTSCLMELILNILLAFVMALSGPHNKQIFFGKFCILKKNSTVNHICLT